MQKTENIKLTLFIDGWCPMCKRFAKKIAQFDRKKQIAIEDIRTISHPSIDKEKAVKALASIDLYGNVFYGFDTIHQLGLTLPLFFVFSPITFFLKISRLGHFLYNELAVRRTIIPLHCNEKKCVSL
jgi:predicted DCC family thiol-disulfide oxidoreductase YuxK